MNKTKKYSFWFHKVNNSATHFLHLYLFMLHLYKHCVCFIERSNRYRGSNVSQCPTSQAGDISTMIFLQYFSAILLSPPFLQRCGVRPPELCVITQLETISLLHICCQGSAKNGTAVGLGDLTSSYGAAELPTPTGRKSNTNHLRDDWVNEPNPGGEDTPHCRTGTRTPFLALL